MQLLPQVPFLQGESLVSYLVRLSKLRAGMPLSGLLGILGLRLANTMRPDKITLECVSNMSGIALHDLQHNSIMPAGSGSCSYRGEAFSKPFLTRSILAYCPACLIEDRTNAASHGIRVMQQAWEFTPTLACPKHDIVLQRNRTTKLASDTIALIEGRRSVDTALEALADQSATLRPSALQAYLTQRFDDKSAVSWLMNYRVDQVAACASIIGSSLEFGIGGQVLTPNAQDQANADSIGFAVLLAGKADIWRCFDQILSRVQRRPKETAPAAAYGKLLRHLAINQSLYAPILPILREHIIDNFALAAGTHVLGTTVLARRNHSIRSLGQAFSVSSQSLTQFLLHKRLLSPPDQGRPLQQQVFSAADGERLAQRLKRALPLRKMRDYLNCDAHTASALVAHGHIERIGGQNKTGDRRAHTLDLVDLTSADDFMERLEKLARLNLEMIEQPLGITSAAYRYHWPVERILNMMQAGRLTQVAKDNNLRGFSSIMLDAREVDRIFNAPAMTPCVNKDKAAERLGIGRASVDKLFRLARPDGAPLVRRVSPLTGSNKRVWHLEATALDELCASEVLRNIRRIQAQ